MNEKHSRREFLTGIAAVATTSVVTGVDWLGAGDQGAAQTQGSLPVTSKRRVAVVRDTHAVNNNFSVNAEIVQRLVDQAVCDATAERKRVTAWKGLVTPQDIVGIKINGIAGAGCCTHPEVVKAIIVGLLEAGVAADNVVVWDRTDGDLVKCGFKLNENRGAVRCYGTNRTGFDDEIQVGPQRTRLSKILSREITALINTPIMKTHGGAGVTLALKNHFGSNSNPADFHGDYCRNGAYLNTAEAIRAKTRICICDALRPLYNGGPGDNPQFRWMYGGIVAGTDPVAHDTVCANILLAQRRKVNPTSYMFAQGPSHVALAAELGLGVADRNHIDRVDTDWS